MVQNSRPNLAATPNHFASGTSSGPRFDKQPNTFGSGRFVSSAPYAGAPHQDSFGNKIAPTKEYNLAAFFGQPRVPITTDPYLDRDNDVFDLPDAYLGKNSYLSLILITHIQAEEMWPLRELFPWKKWESSMEVAWDEWHFNDHMLDREPEETAPRLLTSSFSERRESMVRYGIGLMLEHGFQHTEKGRRNYAMNIQQIKNAVVETAAYSAIWEAFNSRAPVERNRKYRSSSNRSKNDLDALFEEEHDTWAILQKGDGFKRLVERADYAFQRNNPGCSPNYFVFPQGTRKYVSDREEARFWMLDTMPMRDPVAVSMAGRTYRESRPFRVGEHQPDEDPAVTEQTIGGFNTCSFHHISDIKPAEYRTPMLDQIIYDEVRDDFTRYRFVENFECLGLFKDWNTDQPELSDIGEQYFSSHNTWGNYIIESNGENSGERIFEYTVECIEERTRANPEFKRKLDAELARLQQLNADAPARRPAAAGGGGIGNRSARKADAAAAGRRAESSDDGVEYQEEEKEEDGEDGDGQKDGTAAGPFDLISDDDDDLHAFVTGIERIGDPELSEALRSLLVVADSHPNLGTDGWRIMSSQLLEADIKEARSRCVKSAGGKSPGGARFHLTQLEKAMRDKADPYAAELVSPHWLTKGKGCDQCQVRLLSGAPFSDGNALEFNSLAFTLSSQAFVAFELEAGDIAHLIERKGLIETTLPTLSSDPIQLDVWRAGLLQVSAAGSAVLNLILHAHHQTPTDRAKAIRALVSREHISTRSASDLKKAARFALTQLPILHSQKSFEPVLVALKQLLIEYYNNEGISDAQINTLADGVLAVALSSSGGGGTGAQAMRTSTAPRYLDKATNEEKSEATAKVNEAAASAVAAKQPGDRFVNPFVGEVAEKWKEVYIVDKKDKASIWAKLIPEWIKFMNRTDVGFERRQIEFGFLSDLLDPAFRPGAVLMVTTKDELSKRYAKQANPIEPLWTPTQTNPVPSDREVYRKLLRDDDDKPLESLEGLDSIDVGAAEKHFVDGNNALDARKFNQFLDVFFASNLDHSVPIPRDDKWPTTLNPFQVQFFDAVNNAIAVRQKSYRSALLDAKIADGRLIKLFLAYDILCPIGAILFRPHMTYLMGRGFATMGGGMDVGGAGNTMFGHAMFELSDDTQQMMHHGHFVTYNKTMILDKNKIVQLPNVLCKGYVCGNGTKVWNPLNERHIELYKEGKLTRDIFAMPVPINWTSDSYHMDITGAYNPTLGASAEASLNTAYPSAFIATDVWGMDNNLKLGNDSDSLSSPAFSTLCFQAHQQSYNHADKKFTNITIEKTAWGNQIYPSCGKVRRGAELLFKPTNYDGTKTFMLVN